MAMKLLDDLISSLSDEQPNLTDALIKAKILLHRLGRKDLAEWVDLELNGYPDQTPIPPYRVVQAQIVGAVSNGRYRYESHPLPTLHLEEKVRNRFENLETRDSISVLEGLARNDKNGLRRPIPIEFNGFLNEALTGGFKVEHAWCDMGTGRLTEALTQVRSRLLDFLLDLSGKVGDDMSEADVRRVGQSPETASMFNHAIFGDNVTILVGDHSRQTVSNQIALGDFESLEALLQAHDIPAGAVEDLKTAIKADASSISIKDKQFGPSVKEWMKKMLAKIVDGSWQIELGIASNLMTDALKAYYGW